jgi:hypothetical protein
MRKDWFDDDKTEVDAVVGPLFVELNENNGDDNGNHFESSSESSAGGGDDARLVVVDDDNIAPLRVAEAEEVDVNNQDDDDGRGINNETDITRYVSYDRCDNFATVYGLGPMGPWPIPPEVDIVYEQYMNDLYNQINNIDHSANDDVELIEDGSYDVDSIEEEERNYDGISIPDVDAPPAADGESIEEDGDAHSIEEEEEGEEESDDGNDEEESFQEESDDDDDDEEEDEDELEEEESVEEEEEEEESYDQEGNQCRHFVMCSSSNEDGFHNHRDAFGCITYDPWQDIYTNAFRGLITQPRDELILKNRVTPIIQTNKITE